MSEILKKIGVWKFREPEITLAPPVKRVTGYGSVGTAWNRYGEALVAFAKAFDIPLENLLAVMAIEAAGKSHVNGLVIIRFESHVFKDKSGKSYRARRARGLIEGQKAEWRNLEGAAEIDDDAAFLSTSFGLGQIMGFNYSIPSYGSPQDMALAFQNSCLLQIDAIGDFISHNPKLLLAAQTNDWRRFARYYNGPRNVDFYAGKLSTAWLRARELKEKLDV